MTVRPSESGEIFGYYVITHQYFDRYHLPVMHTETNLPDAEKAPAWIRKEWANVHRLLEDGLPMLGFTYYSLTDQVDWDTALSRRQRQREPTRSVRSGTQDPAGGRDAIAKSFVTGSAFCQRKATACT